MKPKKLVSVSMTALVLAMVVISVVSCPEVVEELLRVAKPTFTPDPGTFTESVDVSITCPTEGSEIRYTTDGSIPSSTVGTQYTEPLHITNTTTVKAIAYKEGLLDSAVITATYTGPYYSVTYHPNGATSGTVPTDTTQYQKDDIVTVKGNSGDLAKSGDVFVRWDTRPDGKGVSYVADQTFQIAEDNVDLYAIWNSFYDTTYQIRHYKEQSDGSYSIFETDTMSGIEGTTVYAEPKEYEGYVEFEDHSESVYHGVVLADGSLILRIFYSRNNFKVTYISTDHTSGNVPVDGNIYAGGDKVIVLDNIGDMQRVGYTFDAWNTLANGAGTSYAWSEEFSMPKADVNLYALWNPNTYIVTLDADGGSEPDTKVFDVTFDSLYPSLPDTEREEAIFDGWYTERFGGGKKIINFSSRVTDAEDHTLYANWRDYIVGDKTSHGGYVFYVDDADEFPWTYMEAAPNDLRLIEGSITVDKTEDGYYESSAGYLFGLYRLSDDGTNRYVNGSETFDETSCTKTAIGSGQTNTSLLIGTMGIQAYRWTQPSEWETTDEYAAKLCDELIYNGMADWFLPSKDELQSMYENLYAHGIGEMDGSYWSSSEHPVGSIYAWEHGFYYNSQTLSSRSGDLRVRPCRTF